MKSKSGNSEMGKGGMVLCVLALIFLAGIEAAAQNSNVARVCAEAEARSSGTHRFRREGESFNITLNDVSPDEDEADDASESTSQAEKSINDASDRKTECMPVALELHWNNGRNNGTNFNVNFLDSYRRPIYTRQLSGFLTGSYEFPLAPSSSIESQPWLGSTSLISIPSTITIQAVSPFAYPASISYRVLRVARVRREAEGSFPKAKPATAKDGKNAEIRKADEAQPPEGKKP
ncbi:MAG TPA: hypothetical protein VGW36_07480 [Pyrinomonadaceae bacterium]|nr:hypothetical protein [Pyrinomonadaceae bacterium]